MSKYLVNLGVFVLIAMISSYFVFCQEQSKETKDPKENPKIDFKEFLKNAELAEAHRSTRRLTEQEFISKAKEKGVIILDARSADKFEALHIKGAINLPFSDISIASLEKSLPDKNATILIYCNNNFTGNEIHFASKKAPASLNISTYISLYTYGYRNIYELGPLLDVKKAKVELVSSNKKEKKPSWK